MKIQCEAGALKRALAFVKRAVASRPRVPILANVLVAAQEGGVRLSATDLALGITCWLPALVEREGAVAIPLARLHAFIGSLPQASQTGTRRNGASLAQPALVEMEAQCESDPPLVTLLCGGRKAVVPAAQAEDFPRLPTLGDGEQEGEVRLRLDIPLVCSMVEQVIFAADPRGDRSPASKVLLQLQGGQLLLAARNVALQAVCEAPVPVEPSCALALPASTLIHIAPLLRETGQGTVEIAVSAHGDWKRVLFHTADLDLVSFLPDQAGIPDVGQHALQEPTARVEVDAEALAAALRYIAFVARRNGHRVELAAFPESATLLVAARDRELGEQATEIELANAVEARGFRCETTFALINEVASAVRAPTIWLEWQAESGVLMARTRQAAPACQCTYILRQAATR